MLKKLKGRRSINLERVFTGIVQPILNELTAFAVLHDFKSGQSLIRKEGP